LLHNNSSNTFVSVLSFSSVLEAQEKERRRPQDEFLKQLRGQEVLIVFVDGKAMRGTLIAFDQYNLILEQKSGLTISVFKHSLKYLHKAPQE